MAYFELSDREFTTVLSALRYWQAGLETSGDQLPEFTGKEQRMWFRDFFLEHTPLDLDELDDLCSELNCREREPDLKSMRQLGEAVVEVLRRLVQGEHSDVLGSWAESVIARAWKARVVERAGD